MNESSISSRDMLAMQATGALSRGNAARFALGQPDLLLNIAEQVRHNTDLKNLCLVNRTFHACFAPKLFYELSLSLKAFTPDGHTSLLANRQLRYVRILKFPQHSNFTSRQYREAWSHDLTIGDERCMWPWLLSRSDQDRLVNATMGLLREMPRLTCFHWNSSILNVEFFASLIEALRWRAHSTSDDTFETPLRSLSWHWAPMDDRTRSYPEIYGPGFNLQSLTLQDIYPTPERLTDIAQVLSNSPQLQHLAISCADSGHNVLENLCDRFSSLRASPLRLVHLKLGPGFELTPPRVVPTHVKRSTEAAATYLEKLTDLKDLTHLNLDDMSYEVVAWGTFTTDMLPNLKWFSPDISSDLKVQELYGHSNPNRYKKTNLRQQIVLDFRVLTIDWLHLSPLDHDLSYGGLVYFPSRPPSRSGLGNKPLPFQFPHMRLFGTSVWWSYLRSFCQSCLTSMQSLESLWIKTFRLPQVRGRLQATPSVLGTLSAAAQKAASHCKSLRYIKIEIQAECVEDSRAIVRSWRVIRETGANGSSVARLWELSEDYDEVACPHEFWSEERKIQELISMRV